MTPEQKQLISDWFDEGVAKGATHMVVVCDEFSYEDCPVFVAQVSKDAVCIQGVQNTPDVRQFVKETNSKNMTRVMAVYNLSQDKRSQLTTQFVHNY